MLEPAMGEPATVDPSAVSVEVPFYLMHGFTYLGRCQALVLGSSGTASGLPTM